MPTYRTKVGVDNTIELPSELCEKLDIAPGTEVEFFLSLDGEVFFHAITGKAESWMGLFKTDVRKPPISIREIDEAIADHLAEDDERIRKQSREHTASDKKASAAE
jgi:hypothetical protein